MNNAQKLLASIGGTAEFVAGVGDHWWADAQTPKKDHARPYYGPEGSNGKRTRLRGGYGRALMAKFDEKNIRQ